MNMNLISQYTSNQAIEDGYLMELKGKGFNSISPEKATGGGNDRDFFTLIWRGTKFFVARNETGGLTIMLLSEY